MLIAAAIAPALGAPHFSLQPAGVTRREGERAEFTVQVSGLPPVILQWLRNGEPVGAANAASLTVGPLTEGNDGEQYSVTATGAQGETTSNSAGARMLWWLASEETAQLPIGNFTIKATLDTSANSQAGGWKGVVTGLPVHLSVAAEPAPLTATQIEQKQLLKADYALLLGDKAGARASVNSLLSALPNNTGGLTYDAQLKKAAGKTDAAVESAEKALDQVYLETPEPSEPPVELLSLLATLSEVVPVPPITVEFENKEIAVKWEAEPDSGFRLQKSPNLVDWSLLDVEVQKTLSEFKVLETPTEQRQFFRLARVGP